MDVTGIQIERQWSAARRMYCTVQIERLDKLVVRKTILCATDVCDNGMSGSFPDGRVLVSCIFYIFGLFYNSLPYCKEFGRAMDDTRR